MLERGDDGSFWFKQPGKAAGVLGLTSLPLRIRSSEGLVVLAYAMMLLRSLGSGEISLDMMLFVFFFFLLQRARHRSWI